MGSQGFRNIAGNPFVYQEDTRTAAIGLDLATATWKVSVLATTGALPTTAAQITIDPAVAGNITLTPNGSVAISTFGAAGIVTNSAAGVLSTTATIGVPLGGTGVATFLDHGLLVGSGVAAIDSLAVGGTGVILTGVAGADPTWTTATYPATAAIGDVLVASAANVIGVVTGAATAGYILTANGAGSAPTFQAAPAGVTYASDAETIAGTVTNKAVAPSNLKAKLGTQTSHGIAYGAGDTNAIAWTAEGATGSTIMGTTGNVPSWTGSPSFSGSVTAGTTLTATFGDLTLTDGDAIITNKDVATTSPLVYFKKYRAAAALTSGDLTGTLKFGGYDGTQVTDSARITSTSSGTIASTRVAGDLKFYTHPDSAAADPTLRMTIASTGAITVANPDSGSITIGGIYSVTPGGTLNVALINDSSVLGSVANLGVAQGGIGVGTLTDHGILLGSGTGAITPLGVAANGEIPIGSAGADPVLATITASTGITVVNGAGTITLSSTTVGINNQTASYALLAADVGKLVTMTVAGANTVTVPKDATQTIAVGSQILVYQGGAGVTTIIPEDGTITIRSAGGLTALFAQYSVASLVKIAANLWSLSGDIG